MKKSRLFIAALACFFMQSVSTFADDMIIPASQLPAAATNFVKTNFPGTSIIKIDKERYGYDIELSNDLELKFNKKGQLMNIDD